MDMDMSLGEFLVQMGEKLGEQVIEETEGDTSEDAIEARQEAMELLKLAKELKVKQSLEAVKEKEEEDNGFEKFHQMCEMAEDDVNELVVCTLGAALAIGMGVGFRGDALASHMVAVGKGIYKAIVNFDWANFDEESAVKFLKKAANI